MRLLIAHLREIEVVAEQAPAGVVAKELAQFDRYLDSACGLASNTRAQRVRIIRAFLLASSGLGAQKLASISVGDLRRFLECVFRSKSATYSV